MQRILAAGLVVVAGAANGWSFSREAHALRPAFRGRWRGRLILAIVAEIAAPASVSATKRKTWFPLVERAEGQPKGQRLTRDQLLMKLGAARHEAGRAANLIKVTIPKDSAITASFGFSLLRDKLRHVRRRVGRYLLRTNLTAQAPERLWTFDIQLTEVEQVLALTPI